MKKKTKFVCGVGINDADYLIERRATIDGVRKLIWRCHFYSTWAGMLARCYNRKRQNRKPTYVGCSVAPEWLTFSAFRKWMENQEYEGKDLDKDIIIHGNKIYGPDTCVFVPTNLNKFLNDHGATRGKWPIGVHWDRNAGKFKSQCRCPLTGKRGYLGLFDCPDSAHDAWLTRKHELACQYADQQADPRIATALRKRYLENWSN